MDCRGASLPHGRFLKLVNFFAQPSNILYNKSTKTYIEICICTVHAYSRYCNFSNIYVNNRSPLPKGSCKKVIFLNFYKKNGFIGVCWFQKTYLCLYIYEEEENRYSSANSWGGGVKALAGLSS